MRFRVCVMRCLLLCTMVLLLPAIVTSQPSPPLPGPLPQGNDLLEYMAVDVTSSIKVSNSANHELSEGVVVIQGIFDSAGEKLLELKPVRYYSLHSSHPIPHQQKGHFTVEIIYVSGEVITVPFDALVAGDSSPGITEHGFFEVTVPVSGKIASILITDATRRTIFARIDGSEILS